MAYRPIVLILALVPLLGGCSLKPDEIRSYEAPRIEIPVLDSVAPSDVKARILGIILPTTKGSLFFKVGPAEVSAVAALEPDFDTWVASVAFVEGQGPTWTLPKGWKEVDPGEMNLHAFAVGEGDKAMRVTVANAGGTLLSNINRWRGQVGLKPATQAQMKAVATTIAFGDRTGYRVDLRGASMNKGTMPGAGPGPIKGKVMPDNHPPTDGSPPNAVPAATGGKQRILGVAMPQGERIWFFKVGPVPEAALDAHIAAFDAFISTVKPGAKDDDEPTWEAPASWKAGEKTQFSFGSFTMAPGIRMTITPTGGGLVENLVRWRGQVGLPPIRSIEPTDFGREISIGGRKAYRVDLVGSGGNGGMMAPPSK